MLVAFREDIASQCRVAVADGQDNTVIRTEHRVVSTFVSWAWLPSIDSSFGRINDVGSECVPRREFNACVQRYKGQSRPRGFSCRDQFLSLAFAQLTYRKSLRDIETCLGSLEPKLYHAGFRGKVSRSTLADANRTHDWRIYAAFAQVLIRRARRLYASEPNQIGLSIASFEQGPKIGFSMGFSIEAEQLSRRRKSAFASSKKFQESTKQQRVNEFLI